MADRILSQDSVADPLQYYIDHGITLYCKEVASLYSILTSLDFIIETLKKCATHDTEDKIAIVESKLIVAAQDLKFVKEKLETSKREYTMTVLSQDEITGLCVIGARQDELLFFDMYLNFCDQVLEKGKAEHWLDSNDYDTYQALKNQLTAKSIEKLYSHMSNIIVKYKLNEKIEAHLYYPYVEISHKIHDFIMDIRWHNGNPVFRTQLL